MQSPTLKRPRVLDKKRWEWYFIYFSKMTFVCEELQFYIKLFFYPYWLLGGAICQVNFFLRIINRSSTICFKFWQGNFLCLFFLERYIYSKPTLYSNNLSLCFANEHFKTWFKKTIRLQLDLISVLHINIIVQHH